MVQGMMEGKPWKFPTNNEVGFVDDVSAFHEHIFVDKSLGDFPKPEPVYEQLQGAKWPVAFPKSHIWILNRKWDILSDLKIILMKKWTF